MNRRNFIKLGIGGLISTGLVGTYSIFIERLHYQLNHYALKFKNLPIEFDGYKILHLTDIHVGPYLSFNSYKKLIEKVRTINADIIVLTGDYTHRLSDLREIRKVWHELKTLDAPDGVLNVLGNHDHWDAGRYILDYLEESGQSLRFKTKIIKRGNAEIVFGGAGDFWEDHMNVEHIFKNVHNDQFKVLLAHNPDTIDTINDMDLDLTISGHTHGGQVVFPFLGSTVLPVKNYEYDYGIKDTTMGKLFISRGVGTSILPIRFSCAPEFALLELKKT